MRYFVFLFYFFRILNLEAAQPQFSADDCSTAPSVNLAKDPRVIPKDSLTLLVTQHKASWKKILQVLKNKYKGRDEFEKLTVTRLKEIWASYKQDCPLNGALPSSELEETRASGGESYPPQHLLEDTDNVGSTPDISSPLSRSSDENSLKEGENPKSFYGTLKKWPERGRPQIGGINSEDDYVYSIRPFQSPPKKHQKIF